MTGRRNWGLLAAVAWSVASLMHLKFSLWLVERRETALGTFAFADLVPAAATVAAIALAALVALQLRRNPRPWATAGYWAAWLGAAWLVDRYITFSANEWAHYPQYALIAWLLAHAMDPSRERLWIGRILFWAALLGAVDEVLQYLWITASYSHYFDFNDCVVNVLGAAAGVLLYYGAAPLRPREGRPGLPRVEALALAIVALGVAASLYSGVLALSPDAGVSVPPGGIVHRADGAWRLYLQRGPDHYGSWQASQRWARYYVLPPATGLGLMLGAVMLFAGFGLRRKRVLY